MKPTKTMRKKWSPIPRGVCSLPVATIEEVKEHFAWLMKRRLRVVWKEIRMTTVAKGENRKLMRRMKITRAIEEIEDCLIKEGCRMCDSIIAISRVRGGFVVWAIGYPLRKLPEKR